MRCSSCEPLLDRYLEGTLSPREMKLVHDHLQSCANCAQLLEELKVVDALLFTTTVPELPRNFTFKVMAETFAMPAPKFREHRVWSFVALYVAAAWVAAIAGMLIAGIRPAAIGSAIATGFQYLSQSSTAVIEGIGHGAPALAALGAGALFVDVTAAFAVVLLYIFVRPRLVAHLAAASEDR